MSNVALPVLAQFGRVITTSFELPIDFFNMTLLAAPIAKRGDSMLLPGLLDGFHH
jgi:hypothetical protein